MITETQAQLILAAWKQQAIKHTNLKCDARDLEAIKNAVVRTQEHFACDEDRACQMILTGITLASAGLHAQRHFGRFMSVWLRYNRFLDHTEHQGKMKNRADWLADQRARPKSAAAHG